MFGKKDVFLQPKMLEMAKKIIYCTLWSVALFTATFYTLIGQDNAFVFDGKLSTCTVENAQPIKYLPFFYVLVI